MNQPIDYHLDERGVATLTLNRPDVHNAFDDGMIEAMLECFTALGNASTARVLVLKSASKSFSAGADLSWMQRMADYDFDTNLNDAGRMADMFNALYHLPMPTLAVVNGAAFGGGVGLVAACDFALASPKALFCLSEVALGLVPAVISPYVVESVGLKSFKRLAMSGERFSADQAKSMGLVSHLVDEEALEVSLEAMLAQLLRNGPAAMAASKTLAHEVAYRPIGEQTKQHTSQLIASIRGSNEGREGIRAFLEKRSAAWRENV
ncbi:MAG TPA: enoyl-CoA hydratase-related protein [Pseudomonadales bacterium]|nr:enoyl-CoA hydratase-related protein [Pseudomonadales bacterium]